MKKSIERRLTAAERMLLSRQGSPQVIIIHGGFPCPLQYADGGGRIWERAIDEALEAFENRVITEAKAAKLELVVIGGLPPDRVNSEALEDFLKTHNLPAIPPEEDI